MKDIFLLLFLILSNPIIGQNVKIKGTVKDSLNNPLELASIIAIDASDGSIANYAITDSQGSYVLSIPNNSRYFLQASFLGLKTEEKEFAPREENENVEIDFILLADENELEGVEIVYEMPVIKRGDTLIYNADSFTNGTERKLGDILKKLPGIEVNENGEIRIEGKKVSKVMVEGKEFFYGDSKLASKNIPADAVSKVEVLRNHNDVSQMRGLGDDQQNIAINLKLKEGKRNFWFGEVEGKLGEGEGVRYSGNSRLFYYSPKASFNIIGNINNLGDVPFTFNDYFNFMGGMSLAGGSATTINMNSGDLGFLTMQNDRANESITNFGAANFNYQVNPRWDVSGFSLLSDNYTGFINNTLRRYIKTNATEIHASKSEQRSRLGMAKLKSIYKPNNRFQFDYEFLIKNSRQFEETEAVSIFSQGNIDNFILEDKNNNPFSIIQKANIYYTLTDRNIFAGYFSHTLNNESPLYRALVELFPFVNILPLNEDGENFDITQAKFLDSFSIDGRMDYYYILSKKSNLNLSIGSTTSRQDFDSSIFQLLNSGSRNDVEEPEYNNDVDYDLQDYYFGIKYKVKSGIFTFTPGMSFHYYTSNNFQNGSNTTIRKDLFLPSLLFNAQFKQSEILRFNYQLTTEFTDINNFAEGYMFNRYNRLFKGNRELENTVYHNFELTYLNFSMFNFTNIFASLNYNRRINAITSNSFIEQINLISTPLNSNFPEEILKLNGSFEKTFRRIKTKLNANLFLNTNNLITNQEPLKSQNFTQNYQGSILTNFKKSPHLELGYSKSINHYNLGQLKNIFYTDKIFANIEVNFLQGFKFMAEWNYFNYEDQDEKIKNQYTFVETQLFYQQAESKWEFGLDGKNLLDVKSLNRDSFNENFSSTTEYYVQPRMIMVSINYKI